MSDYDDPPLIVAAVGGAVMSYGVIGAITPWALWLGVGIVIGSLAVLPAGRLLGENHAA